MSFCAGFFWAWLLWVFKTLEPFGLCPSTFGFLKAAFSPNSFGLFYPGLKKFITESIILIALQQRNLEIGRHLSPKKLKIKNLDRRKVANRNTRNTSSRLTIHYAHSFFWQIYSFARKTGRQQSTF